MNSKKTITIKGKKLPYYPRMLTNDGSEPRLNIPVARENLSIFKDIADKYSLPIILIYGTLLGAVRESSFLKHDSDTDITIHEKNEYILLNMIPELEEAGLLFVRYHKVVFFNKGMITYSFMRNEMWIDIYIMQKAFNGYIIFGKKYPKEYFKRLAFISFYEREYLVPYNPEGFLALVYGNGWKIPKPGEHGSPIKHILLIRIYNYMSKWFSKLPFIKNVIKKIIRFMKITNY